MDQPISAPEMGVKPYPIHKLRVTALLDVSATVEDEDQISPLRARQAVGADEDSPSLEMGLEAVQDCLLGLGV